MEISKQKVGLLYNKFENWITGGVFLWYGIKLPKLYEKYSNITNLNLLNQNDLIDLLYILPILIFLALCWYFKSIETPKEIKLTQEIDNKNDEIQNLKDSLDEAQDAISVIKSQNIDDLFLISSQFLRMLAYELKFNNYDRLSVYTHDPKGNMFNLVARFSKNTKFCKKHRKTFSDDEGVLGHVWNNRNGFSFNKIYHCGHTNQKFAKFSEELGIPREISKNFTMKSTEFLLFPIIKNENEVGVVMIESTRVQQVKEDNSSFMHQQKDNINECIRRNNMYLVELIDAYKVVQDRINIAKESNHE